MTSPLTCELLLLTTGSACCVSSCGSHVAVVSFVIIYYPESVSKQHSLRTNVGEGGGLTRWDGDSGGQLQVDEGKRGGTEVDWRMRNARCRRLLSVSDGEFVWIVKAKFHYASWFGAGSKLVRSQIPLCYLVRTSFEPASNQTA